MPNEGRRWIRNAEDRDAVPGTSKVASDSSDVGSAYPLGGLFRKKMSHQATNPVGSMLLEFVVRNYRSFRDEQTLSLVAGANQELESTHTLPIPGTESERALRSAALYGPNASGKSNLLRAMQAMKSVVVRSAVAAQRGDVIEPIHPFRLEAQSRNAPTKFDVSFIAPGKEGETEYRYGFEATRRRVHAEWLYSYPKTRERRWFRREYDPDTGETNYTYGGSLRGEKKQIETATRDNALYLSTAAQLNNESIAPVFDWFRNDLRFIDPGPLSAHTTARLFEDEDGRSDVITLLVAADVGIEDVSVERSESVRSAAARALSQIGNEALSQIMNEFAVEPELDELGLRDEVRESTSRTVRFRHASAEGDAPLLDLEDESHGTQQFFALAGPVISAIASGSVLLVDELDASLHPRMIQEVITLFNDPETNPNGAQLLFNLHDTTPFDNDVLRRDQIWIVEKSSDGASDLIALLEYGPRKGEALEKRYRDGRYGGVPVPRIVQKAKMALHGTSKTA